MVQLGLVQLGLVQRLRTPREIPSKDLNFCQQGSLEWLWKDKEPLSKEEEGSGSLRQSGIRRNSDPSGERHLLVLCLIGAEMPEEFGVCQECLHRKCRGASLRAERGRRC